MPGGHWNTTAGAGELLCWSALASPFLGKLAALRAVPMLLPTSINRAIPLWYTHRGTGLQHYRSCPPSCVAWGVRSFGLVWSEVWFGGAAPQAWQGPAIFEITAFLALVTCMFAVFWPWWHLVFPATLPGDQDWVWTRRKPPCGYRQEAADVLSGHKKQLFTSAPLSQLINALLFQATSCSMVKIWKITQPF